MNIVLKYWKYGVGIVLGAVGGYLYWRFVGCNSGTCPITSSPTISTLYGALIGWLAGGIFHKKKSEAKNKE